MNFCAPDAIRLGALVNEQQILDLTAAWPSQPAPQSVDELIAGGDAADLARRHGFASSICADRAAGG